MHVHKVWLARFSDFEAFDFDPLRFPSNFTSNVDYTIHGGQKIELAQKIHTSRV